MKGRENSEDRFEEEWMAAFDGVQQTPPEQVWDAIDRELTYQELAKYKKRVIYYRWAAAAILLIACSLGTLQYFYYKSSHEGALAELQNKSDFIPFVLENEGVEKSNWPDHPVSDSLPSRFFPNKLERTPEFALANGDGVTHGHLKGDQSESSNNDLSSIPNFSERIPTSGENRLMAFEKQHANEQFKGNELPLDNSSTWVVSQKLQSYQTKDVEALTANLETSEIDLERTIYRLPFYATFGKKKKNKMEGERYFAGLNVGSGSFDPNYQSSSSTLLSDNISSTSTTARSYSSVSEESLSSSSPDVREGMTAGQSISLGVDFGVKLSDRWVLESGVQYARSEAITETNVVIESSTLQEVIPATSQGKSVAQYENAVSSSEVVEYDYRDVDMTNQFEFASVPLKAGYKIFDNKFTMEVNAGVITNIYLGNKLTDSDDDVASLTIGPGDSSPYRTLSFSGLAGIEFGYRFLKNFDLIVEPNYRRAINSLTKEDSDFYAAPSGFGLMTGVRYIFN